MSRYNVLFPADAPPWARRMQPMFTDIFNRIGLWQDSWRKYEVNFIRDFGADNSGRNDITSLLTEALEEGGELYIPNGRYLIAYAGPDAGGVNAFLTKSLRVRCGSDTVFFTDADGVDNDFIRMSAPVGGVGLPEDGIDVVWSGGYFDQYEQQGSTSMPFRTGTPSYAPRKQGASATCDGLSIRGTYTSGVEKNGFRSVTVSGVTFKGGDHWESAGGDSGLFVDGFDLLTVSDITGIGLRDQAIYISGGNAGARGHAVVERGRFKNCFGAVAAKRSLTGTVIRDHSITNCVLGVYLSRLVGTGPAHSVVSGIYSEGSQVEIRAEYCSNVSIVNNHGTNFGAMREDGVTKVDAYTPTGILLQGSTYCRVESNGTVGVNAAYTASNPWYLTLEDFDPGTGAEKSQYNYIANNFSRGFRAIGGETAGEADFNQFDGNYEFSGAVPNVQSDGANTWVRRFDYALGRPVYASPILFQDGSSSAPMIARQGGTTTGIYFGTSKVGIATGRLVRYTNTGYAAAGTTQSTATALLHDFNRVSIVASGAGVKLPIGEVGMELIVDNAGANSLNLYPATGERIDALAVDAPLVIAAGDWKILYCGFAARWKSK